MIDWIKVLRLVLTVANKIAQIVQEKQLMDAGEARAVAKSMVALQSRLGIMEQIRAETAALSEEELDRDLQES